MYNIYIYRYIWLYMNMWFHIWTMVYFLIYNVYIYMHMWFLHIYIHCANDMYMSIKRIYTYSGRYLVHKNCNSKGENSSFPNWTNMTHIPIRLPWHYVRAAVYVWSYIYIYIYICICMCRHPTQPLQQEAVDTVQRWLPPFLVITSAQDRMPIAHMISCWLYTYIIIAYDHIVVLPLTENVVIL